MLLLLLGPLAETETEETGLTVRVGAAGVGKDFSFPTPFGSPLCFARSANARFIFNLRLERISLSVCK